MNGTNASANDAKSTSSPSIESSSKAASPEVQASLRLMQGPSDEAKFAGLLMMVKHLNNLSNSAPAADVRRQVLDAVTPSFLIRLLQSTSTSSVPSCPTHFQILAIAVLATLAQDPSLLSRLRPSIKHVVALLDLETEKEDKEADHNKNLEDCLFILCSFACHDKAGSAQALATHRAAFTVLRCINRLRKQGQKEQEKKEGSALTFAEGKEGGGAAAAVEGKKEEEKKDEEAKDGGGSTTDIPRPRNHGELLQLAAFTLQTLVGMEEDLLPSASQDDAKGVTPQHILDSEGLVLLALMLAEDTTDLKLTVLLPSLATTLMHRQRRAEKEPWEKEMVPASFAPAIRSALLQLLHGGLQETYRDDALCILVDLLRLCGQEWAIEEEEEEGDEDSTGKGKKQVAVGSSVSFFVHVLCAEARMLAEEFESLSVALDDDDELKKDEKLAKRLERAKVTLPLCLDGLDSVLQFLCGVAGRDEDVRPLVLHSTAQKKKATKIRNWEDLPGGILLNIRSSLHDVVGALIKLLKDVGNDLKQFQTADPSTSKFFSSSSCLPSAPPVVVIDFVRRLEEEGLYDVYMHCLFFLSAILAEDEGCLTSAEVLEILPVAVTLVYTDPKRSADDSGKLFGDAFSTTTGSSSSTASSSAIADVVVATSSSSSLLFPFISKVLGLYGLEDETMKGEEQKDDMSLLALVDMQVHLLLIQQVMALLELATLCSSSSSSSSSDAEEQQHDRRRQRIHNRLRQALRLLHELLVRGGLTVPCEDYHCLLAQHPRVLDVLPILAESSAAFTQKEDRTLQVALVTFLLSILVGGEDGKRPGSLYTSEEMERMFPCSGAAYKLLVEALAHVLHERVKESGRSASEEKDGEEERDELTQGWSRLLVLLSTNNKVAGNLRTNVFKRIEGTAGKHEAETVQELLWDEMAAEAASSILEMR